MDALLRMQGLHSVYVGHDHGDSWCGLWPRPKPWSESDSMTATADTGGGSGSGTYASNSRPFLCFCKHSGLGGYGTWHRGVRMVEMEFDELGGLKGVET